MEPFGVKAIEYRGSQRRILTQNKNGPCPLLAIVNTLVLRGEIELHKDWVSILPQRLLDLFISFTVDKNQHGDENATAILAGVLPIVPRLLTGLDVNVRFGG